MAPSGVSCGHRPHALVAAVQAYKSVGQRGIKGEPEAAVVWAKDALEPPIYYSNYKNSRFLALTVL